MDRPANDDARSHRSQRFTPRRSIPLRDWTLQVIPSRRGVVPSEVPEPLVRGGTLRATVPGCVHTDLMPHGFVGDVAVDGSEAADAWVMRTAWRYLTRIDLPEFGSGVA